MCNTIDDYCTTGFHGATRDENCRNVEAKCGIQHARGDLVTVGNADDGISSMGITHILHRVCDDLTARQGIEHAVVAHGNTVIDGNGVEFFCDTASFFNGLLDDVAHIFEVDVSRYEVRVGVGDGDDRFTEIGVFDASGTPEGARSRGITSACRLSRSELRHWPAFLQE